ncbi:3-deoxy-D-arabinoheptulosonate-7-phosphate synthase [Abditibacterium utsteinense]|uniref:Phospho-2-dehydro-3-deoxyheptonate aldolase n=1 Tax=Abditibacterium utsteinense TaxID=1960156 RepID=A0A2S8SR43_9BACT|nr:3-deoxy-7-phosphoheptulonate synthase [Abditibacterium utsteinense]PQV63219.1 3-deoxy-D-arabinoheptulosonate-7-phosphate synthase [Abditibacterium utsteinense]
MNQTSNLHIASNVALPAPAHLCAEIPPTEAQAAFVSASRDEICQIIFGQDPRFLVVVGPCSLHDPEAGLEYGARLAALSRELQDRLFIVMRVYFEKPRTTVGWKGLIMDPHLDGTDDIAAGLRLARRILRQFLELEIPTATELLDPITPQYIADLISWSAIGARTTESQTHRQMASGLSMPLGFKNGTYGHIQPAINAIKAAMQPQTFLGVSEEGVASVVETRGNPNCHIILRGGEERPNYGADDVDQTRAALEGSGLIPAIMIDASHGNCAKDHHKMPGVFREIVRQRAAGENSIIGAMLESNLVAGNQKFPQPLENLVRGQSITDACIDWETTESLLREAHAALASIHAH